MDENEKKLWKAMDQDTADINDVVAQLFRKANETITFILPNGIHVKGRAFKDVEVSELKKSLNRINPDILLGKSASVSPEQEEKARDVIDNYIELSTKIPVEKLKEIGNDKIRMMLILAIIDESGLSENDVKKFRNPP